MRLKKYTKSIASFDILYRSTSLENPLSIPKIKKSSYNLEIINNPHVLADALLLKARTGSETPRVKIKLDQSANVPVRGVRQIEKKTIFRLARGSTSTMGYLLLNYANYAGVTNPQKAAYRSIGKLKKVLLPILDSELSLYRHLAKHDTLKSHGTTTLSLDNTKGIGDMAISSLIPLSLNIKNKDKFNVYRDILRASKN